MSKGKEIGDPLLNARMGKIGGRRPVETVEHVPAAPSESQPIQTFREPPQQPQTPPPVVPVETKTAPQHVVQEARPKRGAKRSKGEREQQTVYLPPDLALWVKVYAVSHKQEISEVVEQALLAWKATKE